MDVKLNDATKIVSVVIASATMLYTLI